MKILVDMHAFSAAHWTGKHIYTLGLLRKMLHNNQDLELILAVPAGVQLRLSTHSRLQQLELDHGWRFYLQFMKLSLSGAYSAILSPTSFITSVLCPLPVITVIYDLAVYHHEFAKNTKAEFIEKLLLPLVTIKSHTIITISEAVKQELAATFPIISKKTKVSLPTPRTFPPAAKQVLKKYSLQPHQFLLYVGTLEPRKNLLNLVRAYKNAVIRLQSVRKPIPLLVIVGVRGWKTTQLFRYIQYHRLDSYIKLLGYVPDEDLPELYKYCHAVTYVPWYEGFGLPVAEAQSFNSICITSNRGALREAATASRLLVNPADHRQITLAILVLWLHKPLHRFLST